MMTPRHQIEELAEALGGIAVYGCLPGSTSELAGVRYGDIVLAVNGQATKDVTEYMTAKALREDGYDLLLFRDGAELTVFVPFRPAMSPESVIAALIEREESRLTPSKTLS